MITAPSQQIQINERDYRTRITLLVLGFSFIRVIVASLTSLGNDEVYYFTYAVQPDWNHFDHPPLVGIFIRLFTCNLLWTSELALRLPAIFGAAINTLLIARCARLIANRNAGLLAAVFYNVGIYTSILSGTFIIPDSVQLTFWLLAVQAGLKAVGSNREQDLNITLLLFGTWTGLAMMSKVHGIFLWFGLFVFIILKKRAWLKNPALYLACGITAASASPILLWNIGNDFISWQFHSERVEINQGFQLKSLLVNLIGQTLYFNPILLVLAILCLTRASSNGFFKDNTFALLLCLGLPIIVATIAVSCFRPTLPHWSGPGYMAVMLIAAAYIAQLSPEKKKLYRNLTNAAVALILFVFVAGSMLALHFPGTLSNPSGLQTGKDDATLDLYRWHELREGFEELRNADIANGRMFDNAPLVVHKWFPGAHIYYYLAYPLKLPVRGLGNLHDLHKFEWMNEMFASYPPGSDAYYITPSNNFTDPATIYAGQFRQIEKAVSITQKRGGKIARYWYIYRLKGALRTF